MSYLALLFVSFLWGTSFVLIKSAAASMSASGIAVSRTLIAALFLIAWASAARMRWPSHPRVWAKLAALAVVGQILPFVMLGAAAHLTTSVDMALMMGSAPLFTFIFGAVIPPSQRPSGLAAFGLIIGFGGVILALSAPLASTSSSPADDVWAGRVFALVAAAGYAGGTLISRNLTRHENTLMVVTASICVSAALLGLWSLVTVKTVVLIPSMYFHLSEIIPVITLGVMNTEVAYMSYVRIIRNYGTLFASLNNYFVPPIGMMVGAIVGHEMIPFALVGGLVLILIGMVFVRWSSGGR